MISLTRVTRKKDGSIFYIKERLGNKFNILVSRDETVENNHGRIECANKGNWYDC